MNEGPFRVIFDAGCKVCAYRASGRTRAAVVFAAMDHVVYAHGDGSTDAHWGVQEIEFYRRAPGGVRE